MVLAEMDCATGNEYGLCCEQQSQYYAVERCVDNPPVSHKSPSNPIAQKHVNWFGKLSVHVPLFPQGLLSHSLKSEI